MIRLKTLKQITCRFRNDVPSLNLKARVNIQKVFGIHSVRGHISSTDQGIQAAAGGY